MMRTNKPLAWLFSAFLLATLTLTACGHTSSSNGGNTPKFGGTITDGLFEEPDSLLPELSVETYSDLVDAAIWAPLYYGDNTGVIQPGLATPVPTAANGGISPDAKTYTIHLRSGLKWSDGSPLTSDDVAFTLNLFKNPSYGAKTQASEFANIASVTTPDPTTVVINLSKPDVVFLALALTDPLSFAPLPKSVFGSMSPASVSKSSQAFQPTVTSGPFTVSDRVKSDHITVVKNPNYFQAPKPYLDKIVFKIIPDQNTILTALQSGTIDTSWFLDVNQLAAYRAISGYQVALDKTPGSFEAIYFNMTNPFLADLKVRQAITMGIDVTPIIQNIWKGIASLTCDDGPGTFAHDPSLIPCYTYNQSQAMATLQGDGFTMGSDGYFHKGGKTLELRYSTTAGKAYREQTETIVQDQLHKIGIKIDIVNYPSDTFFGSVLADYSKFDIAEFANALTYDPDNHTQWGCDQFLPVGFNISHWCNQDAETQIKKELSDPNQADRTAAFHQLYKDILTDLPAMFYYQFPNISCATQRLHNYAPSPTGPSETWNVWDWWLS
jgi:peptide/nickel transport system substrate-binding protein